MMNYAQEYLARISEEELYEDYLRQCLRGPGRARPYGCRKYFGINSETEYIGTLQDGKELTDIYEDSDGDYWFSKRILIGGWAITMAEFTQGRKDLNDAYQEHTGILSDWEKVRERYGGVPSGWERVCPEDQEEDYGRDENSSIDERAVKGTAGYEKAI